MINFTQAFDSAWERMHVILFRPFDFGKWCAIGFSAFLAGFLQGGNGFNSSYNQNFNNSSFNKYGGTQTPNFDVHHLNTNFNNLIAGMQVGLIILIAVGVFVLILGFILLLYWLGARGQFLFLDNIVRNRGAIAWPWTYYSRQANSLFGFYLLFLLITLLIMVPIIVAGVFMAIPLFKQHRWPVGGEIIEFVVLALIYFAVAIVIGVIMFIFREFGTAIMFRQGMLARPAFVASMRLIAQQPGNIALFVLLRIAIFIAVAVISLILCCLTIPCCCLTQWPYVGTVILLPVWVYVRCFTLDCLAQMAPECNVWTVDVPPPGTAPLSPISPPRPPG